MPASDIFIISEDAAVRQELAAMISAGGLGDAIIFHSSADFMAHYDPAWRGCILLDLRISAHEGLKLQRHCQTLHCTIPLVFILVENAVPVAIELVTGYQFTCFDRPQVGDALLACVRDGLRWQTEYCTTEAKQAQIRTLYATTTRREREVMEQLARGRTNKQIGADLGVSPRTVEIYRGRVLQKMQAETTADLVRLSLTISNGLSG